MVGVEAGGEEGVALMVVITLRVMGVDFDTFTIIGIISSPLTHDGA